MNSRIQRLSKISMFLLAILPILDYYVFAGQFNYADIAGILVFSLAFLCGVLHRYSIPKSYLLYWVYVTLQIYFIAGIGGWSDYIPGGVNFAMFSMFLFGFAATFKLDLLYKYMKWVFILASALLLFQQLIYLTSHIKVSVFLPLGNQLTYVGMTYKELVNVQSSISGGLIERFSSIFTEPSHFAQYGLLLLSIELFKPSNLNKLFTKFSIFIAIILILIQAGSGFIGLLAIAIIKLVYVVFITREKKYYFYLAILIPVLLVVVNSYLNSAAGAYISERTSELGLYDDRDQTNSTFVRVYYGWYAWGDLDIFHKLFGASRSYISALRESGFFNGVTYVFCTQGLVGFILLLSFFYIHCKGKTVLSAAIALIFLVISLFGSTYLGALMMIVTAVVLGSMWSSLELK